MDLGLLPAALWKQSGSNCDITVQDSPQSEFKVSAWESVVPIRGGAVFRTIKHGMRWTYIRLLWLR